MADPETDSPTTEHLKIQWHLSRDLLSVATYSSNSGGFVGFFTKKVLLVDAFHPSIGHYRFCFFNLGRKSLLSFKCSAKLQADVVFLWQNFLNIQMIFFSSAFVGILLSQFWLLDGLHWMVGMVY